MTVTVADEVEIPIRVWRVAYIERVLSTEEDSDPRVVWFETQRGFEDFVADAWLSQQRNRVQQTVILSAHRVLIESSALLEIDVGVNVTVSV